MLTITAEILGILTKRQARPLAGPRHKYCDFPTTTTCIMLHVTHNIELGMLNDITVSTISHKVNSTRSRERTVMRVTFRRQITSMCLRKFRCQSQGFSRQFAIETYVYEVLVLTGDRVKGCWSTCWTTPCGILGPCNAGSPHDRLYCEWPKYASY